MRGRAILGADEPEKVRPLLDAYLARFLAHVPSARGHGDQFLRPVFHGVGVEHEEAPIPGGHAVIRGEEKVDQVEPGMTLAIRKPRDLPRGLRRARRGHRMGQSRRSGRAHPLP